MFSAAFQLTSVIYLTVCLGDEEGGEEEEEEGEIGEEEEEEGDVEDDPVGDEDYDPAQDEQGLVAVPILFF